MIDIIYEPQNNRSAAYDGEKAIGECTYSPSDTLWIIDHTFVDSAYGGQGIAKKLVAKLVDEARTAEKKVLPLCSFAKREFALEESYHDVLAAPEQ